MSADDDKEVLIPEVLPPDHGRARGSYRPPPPPRQERPPRPASPLDKIANVLGPVFSGLLLDIFSFAIPGKPSAFFICTVLGFWFGRVCGLRFRHCLLAAVIAGYYGMLQIPRLVPFAACAGLFFTLKNAEFWKKR